MSPARGEMTIYADDLLVHVINPNEDHARRKMLDTLARIRDCYLANELNIEPSKCQAINFSRHHDSGEPLKLIGVEIPWSSQVKILSIWFSRTLTFTPHFTATRLNAECIIWRLSSLALAEWPVLTYRESLTPSPAVV